MMTTEIYVFNMLQREKYIAPKIYELLPEPLKNNNKKIKKK